MVTKDQVLVVIESMKMETAIRSPQAGRVKRVVHGQGVCYDPIFFSFSPSSFFDEKVKD